MRAGARSSHNRAKICDESSPGGRRDKTRCKGLQRGDLFVLKEVRSLNGCERGKQRRKSSGWEEAAVFISQSAGINSQRRMFRMEEYTEVSKVGCRREEPHSLEEGSR